MARIISLSEAIQANVRDGDTVAMVPRDLRARTVEAHGAAAS